MKKSQVKAVVPITLRAKWRRMRNQISTFQLSKGRGAGRRSWGGFMGLGVVADSLISERAGRDKLKDQQGPEVIDVGMGRPGHQQVADGIEIAIGVVAVEVVGQLDTRRLGPAQRV